MTTSRILKCVLLAYKSFNQQFTPEHKAIPKIYEKLSMPTPTIHFQVRKNVSFREAQVTGLP